MGTINRGYNLYFFELGNQMSLNGTITHELGHPFGPQGRRTYNPDCTDGQKKQASRTCISYPLPNN